MIYGSSGDALLLSCMQSSTSTREQTPEAAQQARRGYRGHREGVRVGWEGEVGGFSRSPSLLYKFTNYWNYHSNSLLIAFICLKLI